MADTIDITCPTCDKAMKVPAQHLGKKIRCKGCGSIVPVTPAKETIPLADEPEESGAKPPPPAAASAERGKVTWDDDADNDNKPMSVVHEDDTPRCPHCAQVLDPPDAIICVNCGFNNRTRVKAETKRVYAPDTGEWFNHLGPATLAFVFVVILFVLDISCIVNMRYWLEGSLIESDEDSFDGTTKKLYIHQGFFISMAIFFSIVVSVPLIRYSFRRLLYNYLPAEQLMQE